MSARRDKRKRGRDPRRQSFFDASTSEEDKANQRRLSTRRKSEVVTVDDGFTFKQKSKKAKQLENTDVSAQAKEAAVSEEAPKAKEPKEKRTKKLPVPQYPATELTLPEGWGTEGSDHAGGPLAFQRFLEHVLENEISSLSSVFNGPFGFVSAALSMVCTQFLESVEKEAVAPPKKAVVVKRNPEMQRLRKRELVWTQFLESAAEELRQWAEIKAKCTPNDSSEAAVAGQQQPKGQQWSSLLAQEDQQFLKANVVGQLSAAVMTSCSVLSIKRDCVLKSLRILNAKVDACDKYVRRAGRDVNAVVLQPYGGFDPKSFILGE